MAVTVGAWPTLQGSGGGLQLMQLLPERGVQLAEGVDVAAVARPRPPKGVDALLLASPLVGGG
jgi:hypothetical protein